MAQTQILYYMYRPNTATRCILRAFATMQQNVTVAGAPLWMPLHGRACSAPPDPLAVFRGEAERGGKGEVGLGNREGERQGGKLELGCRLA